MRIVRREHQELFVLGSRRPRENAHVPPLGDHESYVVFVKIHRQRRASELNPEMSFIVCH